MNETTVRRGLLTRLAWAATAVAIASCTHTGTGGPQDVVPNEARDDGGKAVTGEQPAETGRPAGPAGPAKPAKKESKVLAERMLLEGQPVMDPKAPGDPGAVARAPMAVTAPPAAGAARPGVSLAKPDRIETANREAYDAIAENDFHRTDADPLSTFSIDVDTASYSNVRRMLKDGHLPPAGAVRIEELLNYFEYDYPKARGDAPFSTFVEAGPCPWNRQHRLVHLGLRGRTLDPGKVPPRNLVFLLDVSGSMSSPDKLPLLKSAFEILVDQLNEDDSVAIVVYAGASGLALPATHGDDKERIRQALRELRSGGSTNGGAGIRLAYRVARENFRKDAINRVILATDGDFNVGVSNRSELVRLIEKEREDGVFLTVLGLGRGNLQDSTMEQLADKGNGNYAYLDSIAEAKKVLGQQCGSTLITIAKDVKIQVEFNPRLVAAYRLIGYENRRMAAQDFADDKKDAGEIGAGHSVTALYEIVPRGADTELPEAPKLKYQATKELTLAADSDELMTLRLRYKQPTGTVSQLITAGVKDPGAAAKTSHEFDFAAGVAMFGMLLRESKYAGTSSFTLAGELAKGGLGKDPHGYRAEFLTLVERAGQLRGAATAGDGSR